MNKKPCLEIVGFSAWKAATRVTFDAALGEKYLHLTAFVFKCLKFLLLSSSVTHAHGAEVIHIFITDC